MSTSLADLAPGQTATVCGFAEAGTLVQRLMQLGIVEGSAVEIVRFAPAGDPVEIRVMGYALSLRVEEARHVLVDDVS